MKKLIAITALSSLASLTHALPLINLDIGTGVWMPEYSGELGESQTAVDSLNLSEDNANVYYATLEFPVPVVPAVRIKHTDLSTEGNSDITVDFQLDDFTFSADGDLYTSLDLTHTDYTLYWGLPKFYLDVDFGATIRQFDGEAIATGTVTGQTEQQTENVDIDIIIPMLFADVRLDLPFTGLYLGVDGNFISAGDNTLSDFTAKVGYNTDALPILLDLEFEAGYRSMELKVDESDIQADVTIEGPYLGVQIAF